MIHTKQWLHKNAGSKGRYFTILFKAAKLEYIAMVLNKPAEKKTMPEKSIIYENGFLSM